MKMKEQDADESRDRRCRGTLYSVLGAGFCCSALLQGGLDTVNYRHVLRRLPDKAEIFFTDSGHDARARYEISSISSKMMRRRDVASNKQSSPPPESPASSGSLTPKRQIRRLPSGEKVEDIRAKVRLSEHGEARLVAVSCILAATRTPADPPTLHVARHAV
jgi:hypothetical protein